MEPEMNNMTSEHKSFFDEKKKTENLIIDDKLQKVEEKNLKKTKKEIKEISKNKKDNFLRQIENYLNTVIEEDLNYRLNDLAVEDITGEKFSFSFAEDFWNDVKEDINEKFLKNEN